MLRPSVTPFSAAAGRTKAVTLSTASASEKSSSRRWKSPASIRATSRMSSTAVSIVPVASLTSARERVCSVLKGPLLPSNSV